MRYLQRSLLDCKWTAMTGIARSILFIRLCGPATSSNQFWLCDKEDRMPRCSKVMVVPVWVRTGVKPLNVFPTQMNLRHTDTKPESPSSLLASPRALYVHLVSSATMSTGPYTTVSLQSLYWETPRWKDMCWFGHCPISYSTPPPLSVFRALWGTFLLTI